MYRNSTGRENKPVFQVGLKGTLADWVRNVHSNTEFYINADHKLKSYPDMIHT